MKANHVLLQALLESINSMIEHQYAANGNLIYAVWRSRKRIEALRQFTLEGGHAEIERAAQRSKEAALDDSLSRSSTVDTVVSPTTAHPEGAMDGTFAIGDSDDSDNEEPPTPSQSAQSMRTSRTGSMASSSVPEDHVPIQLIGLSEKARGKMPANAPTFSRQNSTTSLSATSTYSVGRGSFAATPEWLESWLPDLPLHTILTVIKVLSAHPLAVPGTNATDGTNPPSVASSPRSSLAADDAPATNSPNTTQPTNPTLTDFRSAIPATAIHPSISTILSSPSPIRVHLFEWSPLSLGWYMSVMWSLIFTAEMTIAPASSTAATLTGTGVMAGPVGVWNGTNVKLFQVATEGRREGPSLSAPRGAVDAVGSRLVQGVQGLNLGGIGGLVGRVGAGVRNASQGNIHTGDGNARTREV